MPGIYCASFFLAGCAANGPGKGKAQSDFLKESTAVLDFMSSYGLIKNDFEHGRIMKARSRVLAMEKSNHDYVKAHRLLRQKIEPARSRLFGHFLDKARKAEKKEAMVEGHVSL